MDCFATVVRLMPRLFLVLSLAFVAWFSTSASASFTAVSTPRYYDPNGNVSGYFSTTAALCAARGPWAIYVETEAIGSRTSGQVGKCTDSGGWIANRVNFSYALACPSNSTGTTSCTCNSGYVQNSTNTACEVYVDPNTAICAAKAGQSGGSYEAPHVQGSSMESTYGFLCEPYTGTNCTMAINYLMAWEYPQGSGTWIKVGNGVYTGETCTVSGVTSVTGPSSGSPVAAPTEALCDEGSVRGIVNGVSTCSPPSDMNVIQAVKTTTATSPAGAASAPTSGLGSDAPPTAVKAEEQVSCVDGKCTTETKFTDSAGAVVGTTSITDSQSAFCSENPSAPVCGGDAGTMSDFCKKNPTVLSCVTANLGELTEEAIPNEDIGLSIVADTGWGAGAGSCPAPRTVQLSGMSLSMPFDLLCDFAAGIRPVIIGLAWLVAALAFFGFARKD